MDWVNMVRSLRLQISPANVLPGNTSEPRAIVASSSLFLEHSIKRVRQPDITSVRLHLTEDTDNHFSIGVCWGSIPPKISHAAARLKTGNLIETVACAVLKRFR